MPAHSYGGMCGRGHHPPNPDDTKGITMTTKKDAVRDFVTHWFNNIPAHYVFRGNEWEEFAFYGNHYDDDTEDYVIDDCADIPMWGTLFLISDIWLEEFVREHMHEVAELGFVVIESYEYGDLFLGVDGAGYDFYEAHWTPLYDLCKFNWHNEDE